jgi:hypothetical protein
MFKECHRIVVATVVAPRLRPFLEKFERKKSKFKLVFFIVLVF